MAAAAAIPASVDERPVTAAGGGRGLGGIVTRWWRRIAWRRRPRRPSLNEIPALCLGFSPRWRGAETMSLFPGGTHHFRVPLFFCPQEFVPGVCSRFPGTSVRELSARGEELILALLGGGKYLRVLRHIPHRRHGRVFLQRHVWTKITLDSALDKTNADLFLSAENHVASEGVSVFGIGDGQHPGFKLPRQFTRFRRRRIFYAGLKEHIVGTVRGQTPRGLLRFFQFTFPQKNSYVVAHR